MDILILNLKSPFLNLKKTEMKYVGMHSLIQRNNRLSVLMLLGFPAILLAAVWLFMAIINYLGNSSGYDSRGYRQNFLDADAVNTSFLSVACREGRAADAPRQSSRI